MPTPREIKRRIRSVRNIAKVTGALEAVSASKVRRAQGQALASRDYTAAAYEILADLALFHDAGIDHPLLMPHGTVENILVIVISGDRGLAGPYNTNIVRAAMDFAAEQSVPVSYITVGKKGRDLLARRGANIVAEFTDLPDVPSILDIAAIARTAMDDFLSEQFNEVCIAYTSFVNTLRQDPVTRRLLPLVPEQKHMGEMGSRETRGPRPVFGFEPDARSILEEILPRFTEVLLFQALVEALASEHSARMVAMRSATENAHALVEDLTLRYNKARQLAITSEMLDIVGGAEALSQSHRQDRTGTPAF